MPHLIAELPSKYQAIFSQEISLKKLELLEVAIPQVESFRSAIGVRYERQALFVRWYDQYGNWGIGECSARPDPYFSGEFVAGAISVLQNFIFPQLSKNQTVGDLVQILSKIRGWNFTVTALYDAFFDLLRRQGKQDLLDLWSGKSRQEIPVGISLGLFETEKSAVERVEKAIASGYHRVKLKISSKMNRATLKAIRTEFPELYLGFDANGSCGDSDMEFIRSLEEFQPAVLEQPFSPRRLDLCTKLKQQSSSLRICLDESVADLGDLLVAHQLGIIDELNIKPGRVGGPLATIAILKYCEENKIPVWVGGMFETGVGRTANLRVASRLPQAIAHDLSPSRRYFKVDVLKNPIEMSQEGYVSLTNEEPVILDEAALQHHLKQKIVLEKD